jgi:quinol monooxygenase YgiN
MTTMLIAHVTFLVSDADRPAALGALEAEAATVRSMPGCLAFVPFTDATDPRQLGVLHEWRSAEDFANYTRSETFKRFGAAVRPLMTAPAVSQRFEARLIEKTD